MEMFLLTEAPRFSLVSDVLVLKEAELVAVPGAEGGVAIGIEGEIGMKEVDEIVTLGIGAQGTGVTKGMGSG